MIKKEDLIKIGKEYLPLILDKKGELIYSSHETLKKGDIYLLGLNPGGEGYETIEKHLSKLLEKETNSYLDERWKNEIASWPKGQAPLQIRVDYLLRNLGYKTRDVCESNLIFVTSKSIEDLEYGDFSNFKQLANYCWQYHEILMKIIQPKVILCFGNGEKSSYSFLYSHYIGVEATFPSGHGNWNCKAFTTVVQGRKTSVVSVPHLSRYNVVCKGDVINWIKGFLK